jgi:hypothetical protein
MGSKSKSPTIDDLRLMEFKLFIIEFNKASQLDRSFSNSLSPEIKVRFRTRLIDICLMLMEKIDKNEFSNKILREKIVELSNVHENISIGQAQKVINVVMKQYCFLLGKSNLYTELDCPLDSTTMRHKNTMKNLSMDDYLRYQVKFDEKYELRILADYVYDKKRLQTFLNNHAAN